MIKNISEEESKSVEHKIQTEEVFYELESPSKLLLVPGFEEAEFQTQESIRNQLDIFWTLDPQLQLKISDKLDLILKAAGFKDFERSISSIFTVLPDKIEPVYEVSSNLCKNATFVFQILRDERRFSANQAKSIQDVLLFFLFECISQKNESVRLSARDTVRASSKFFTDADHFILPSILTIFNGKGTLESKIICVELIPFLVNVFSSKKAESFLMPELLFLAKDPYPELRKVACNAIFSLLDHFRFKTPSLNDELFQIGEKVLKENSTFAVLIPRIVLALSKTTRFEKLETKFFPTFFSILSKPKIPDDAVECLGALILIVIESGVSLNNLPQLSKLHQLYFTLPLKNHRAELVFSKTVSKIIRERNNSDWTLIKKDIQHIFSSQSPNLQTFKVYFMKNLPLLAKKIATEQVEIELLMIIQDYFIKSESLVRIWTYSSLPKVIKELHPTTRERYADVFVELVTENYKDWRLRMQAVESIVELSRLFSRRTRLMKVIPLYLALMKDDCSIVRKNASQNFWKLFEEVSENEEAKTFMRGALISFSRYPKFTYRVSFIEMLKGIIFHVLHLLDAGMVKACIDLATDKVLNVLIMVGKLLKDLREGDPFSHPKRPDLLQQDPNHPDHWAQSGCWIFELVDRLCKKTDSDLFYVQQELLKDEQEKLDALKKMFTDQIEEKKRTMTLENNRVSEIRARKAIEEAELRKESDEELVYAATMLLNDSGISPISEKIGDKSEQVDPVLIENQTEIDLARVIDVDRPISKSNDEISVLFSKRTEDISSSKSKTKYEKVEYDENNEKDQINKLISSSEINDNSQNKEFITSPEIKEKNLKEQLTLQSEIQENDKIEENHTSSETREIYQIDNYDQKEELKSSSKTSNNNEENRKGELINMPEIGENNEKYVKNQTNQQNHKEQKDKKYPNNSSFQADQNDQTNQGEQKDTIFANITSDKNDKSDQKNQTNQQDQLVENNNSEQIDLGNEKDQKNKVHFNDQINQADQTTQIILSDQKPEKHQTNENSQTNEDYLRNQRDEDNIRNKKNQIDEDIQKDEQAQNNTSDIIYLTAQKDLRDQTDIKDLQDESYQKDPRDEQNKNILRNQKYVIHQKDENARDFKENQSDHLSQKNQRYQTGEQDENDKLNITNNGREKYQNDEEVENSQKDLKDQRDKENENLQRNENYRRDEEDNKDEQNLRKYRDVKDDRNQLDIKEQNDIKYQKDEEYAKIHRDILDSKDDKVQTSLNNQKHQTNEESKTAHENQRNEENQTVQKDIHIQIPQEYDKDQQIKENIEDEKDQHEQRNEEGEIDQRNPNDQLSQNDRKGEGDQQLQRDEKGQLVSINEKTEKHSRDESDHLNQLDYKYDNYHKDQQYEKGEENVNVQKDPKDPMAQNDKSYQSGMNDKNQNTNESKNIDIQNGIDLSKVSTAKNASNDSQIEAENSHFEENPNGKTKSRTLDSDQIVKLRNFKKSGDANLGTRNKMVRLKKEPVDSVVISSKGTLFKNIKLKEEYDFDDEKEKNLQEVRMSKTYSLLEKETMHVNIDNVTFDIEKKIEEVPEEFVETEDSFPESVGGGRISSARASQIRSSQVR